MNSIKQVLTKELKTLDLFNEQMLNNMVSEYVDLYSVTVKFDSYTNGNLVHKKYSMFLDKFINVFEKTPKQFIDCYSFNHNYKQIRNVSITFYRNNDLLLSADHFNMVPDILKIISLNDLDISKLKI